MIKKEIKVFCFISITVIYKQVLTNLTLINFVDSDWLVQVQTLEDFRDVRGEFVEADLLEVTQHRHHHALGQLGAGGRAGGGEGRGGGHQQHAARPDSPARVGHVVTLVLAITSVIISPEAIIHPLYSHLAVAIVLLPRPHRPAEAVVEVVSAPAHPGPGLRAPQLRHRLAGEVAGQVARLGRALALATAANSLSSYFGNGLVRT